MQGADRRTTVMIRNIPNKYTQVGSGLVWAQVGLGLANVSDLHTPAALSILSLLLLVLLLLFI